MNHVVKQRKIVRNVNLLIIVIQELLAKLVLGNLTVLNVHKLPINVRNAIQDTIQMIQDVLLVQLSQVVNHVKKKQKHVQHVQQKPAYFFLSK